MTDEFDYAVEQIVFDWLGEQTCRVCHKVTFHVFTSTFIVERQCHQDVRVVLVRSNACGRGWIGWALSVECVDCFLQRRSGGDGRLQRMLCAREG